MTYSEYSDKLKEQLRKAKKAYRLRNIDKCREQNKLRQRNYREFERLRKMDLFEEEPESKKN